MSVETFESDEAAMLRALDFARRGIGAVEPNPAVGAVLIDSNRQFISAGFHTQFGAPHAEVEAIRAAGDETQGATLYVTLEPCSHHGKTPPCADGVIAAGIRKVVVATVDPAPHVAGQGIEKLRAAGIEVVVGVCEAAARELISPFVKLQLQQQPFVHAKWAMTLDGKIASRTGSSKWISNEKSREVVHQLRGRMDAIITGIGTVLADDPLLTVRPAGIRTPVRVVLDSRGRLPIDSQLVQTAGEVPVLLFTTDAAGEEHLQQLAERGVEVIQTSRSSEGRHLCLTEVLQNLGQRQFTNVLLEAGSGIMGAFCDAEAIDEVHCFVAPKLIGGAGALSPVGGLGLESMENALELIRPRD